MINYKPSRIMKAQFKVGDKVRIINWGHHIYKWVDDEVVAIDIAPELKGLVGTIKEVVTTQFVLKYSLDGINKIAWYSENQLELVEQ